MHSESERGHCLKFTKISWNFSKGKYQTIQSYQVFNYTIDTDWFTQNLYFGKFYYHWTLFKSVLDPVGTFWLNIRISLLGMCDWPNALLNSYVKSFGYLIPVESLEPGWNHLNPIEPCWNPLNDLYGSGQLWPMKYPEHDNMHPHCLDILWHHMLVIAVCVSAWICLIITMVQTHAIYGEILTFETILNNSCWVTCIYLLLFGRQTLRISARAIAKICRREPVWHAPLSLDRMVSGSCITWATKSHYLEMAHGGLSRIRRGFGWSPTG